MIFSEKYTNIKNIESLMCRKLLVDWLITFGNTNKFIKFTGNRKDKNISNPLEVRILEVNFYHPLHATNFFHTNFDFFFLSSLIFTSLHFRTRKNFRSMEIE